MTKLLLSSGKPDFFHIYLSVFSFYSLSLCLSSLIFFLLSSSALSALGKYFHLHCNSYCFSFIYFIFIYFFIYNTYLNFMSQP